MERGYLAEFGKKNATQMMIFLPIENVGRKIKNYNTFNLRTAESRNNDYNMVAPTAVYISKDRKLIFPFLNL